MKSWSIAQSCVPSQMATRKSVVNPREFGPNDWRFDMAREPTGVDYMPGNAIQSDANFFALREPYQMVKNGMFNPLTGQEPIYGFVNYDLNPLDQEQTNAHMSGYQIQKKTRVADNMSPLYVMKAPTYMYSINNPTSAWVNTYQGSKSRAPYQR